MVWDTDPASDTFHLPSGRPQLRIQGDTEMDYRGYGFITLINKPRVVPHAFNLSAWESRRRWNSEVEVNLVSIVSSRLATQ